MVDPALTPDRVLVTVGTACTMSGVGSTETHRALVAEEPNAIGFAAFDAGLVDIDVDRGTAAEPRFVGSRGEVLTAATIEAEHGPALRAALGIRSLSRETLAGHVLTDIAAPLPADLDVDGLRRQAGLSFKELRASGLADMFGLFDDDPRLAPSLQSQLFVYGGIGALAALPSPLSRMMEHPGRFRIAAGCAFPGFDSHAAQTLGMQPKHELVEDKKSDRLAYRLAASLTTHGPALIATMLSPGFNLSRVRRNPDMLEALLDGRSPMRRVPQAPMVTNAACASALVTFSDVATQMVCRYPGIVSPELIIWTAADAALKPDGRILEAFGLGAMMSVEKLAALNADRALDERRSVGESLAPFDVDAQGTVVGHGGSGIVVTTLDFALRHGLDITSIVVGWGQSGETGAKGHFAGVGFGGENALIAALEMAWQGHGYGVESFGHVVAHATGTRTNSRTELSTLHAARRAAADRQGFSGRLPVMSVSAPKAIGDGHTMGETGLKAVAEAVRFVLGDPTVAVPTLRRLDPDLGEPAEFVELRREPHPGDADGGAVVPTQGFGGYDGAIALRSATPDALKRYSVDSKVLEAYLERWPEIRRERIEREARHRRTRDATLRLAEEHRWPGPA